MKINKKNMIINTSRPVLQFIWFPVWSIPSSGFSGGACIRLAAIVWCLYCALCSLSTEFLGNSKWGLYFCHKVWAFTIFLEAMLKLFSLRTKWKGKEQMETVPKQWGNKCSCQHKIWVRHSGVFCFHIICILPVLPYYQLLFFAHLFFWVSVSPGLFHCLVIKHYGFSVIFALI